jgi:uncharacterized protein
MHGAIPWDFALVFIFLALIVPWRGYVRVRQLIKRESIATADRLVLYASTIAFQWIVTVFVLWRCAARGYAPPMLGLALPRPWLAIGAGVLLSGLITANQLASIRRLASLPREKQGFFRSLSLELMPQNNIERLAFFGLVTTVAICEEILYRGWAQMVFQNLLGGSVLAAVLASAILFSIAHAYQGRRGLVATFIVGVVFSSVRVWTGSLLPTIAAHFVADISAGLIAPVWLNAADAKAGSREALDSARDPAGLRSES